jgi:hypothetical protein
MIDRNASLLGRREKANVPLAVTGRGGWVSLRMDF